MTKPKAVVAVRPVLTGRSATVDEKYTTTHAIYTAMTGSTEWAAATDVHQPAADFLEAADDLYANQAAINDLLAQLAARRVDEAVLLEVWGSELHLCRGAIKKYCAGSKVKCLALGWGPGERTARPPAGAPFDLLPRRSTVSGTATFVWSCDRYQHEYQVQWCTDTANPATYSAPRTVSKRRFQLGGQTPGAILHFRALTLDSKLPAGQTEWSAWVAVPVVS